MGYEDIKLQIHKAYSGSPEEEQKKPRGEARASSRRLRKSSYRISQFDTVPLVMNKGVFQ